MVFSPLVFSLPLFPKVAILLAIALSVSGSAALGEAAIAQTPSLPASNPSLPPVVNSLPEGTPLKAGDRLRITVVGFPDLSGEQVILSDGTVQLPLAGSVSIQGLTPLQARQQLTTALLPYVRRPQVGLSILSVSPPRISISGAVLNPGPRLLVTSFNQPAPAAFTLSDVLSMAGGIAPNADIRNIVIRRALPDPAGPARKSDIRVDLWQALQGDLAANPAVYNGDEIIVPIAPLPPADQQALLTSTLAPTRITVQVAGEVERPGQIEMAPTASISSAVAAAGGLTDDADRDGVALLRMMPNGQLVRQTFEFGMPTPPLMNGDLIVVGKSRGSRFLETLGRVLSPLGQLFLLFQ